MKTIRIRYIVAVVLVFLFLLSAGFVNASDSDYTPKAVVLTTKGPITQILVEYIDRGMTLAIKENADVIILQIDTPGGSVDVMNDIVQKIRNSSIPVVVYVSPRNAMAGSAGTIITLAGHLAAMAPETTIGAASPVGSQGEDIGETMEGKVKEMLKASVRAIAKDRSLEAIALAEETIETSRAVTDIEALEVGLIDIRAADLDDLLDQLNGRKVTVGNREVTLETENAEKISVENTFIEELLQLLINPNLVFILLAIGIQAILIELSSPGGWVAGFLGAVCLILAVYSLGFLPVNWFGILFIIIAIILFILEINTPTFGALTVAGGISFITGSLILFNSMRLPGYPSVSVPLVVGTGIFLAGSFLVILTFALRALRSPIAVGSESFPGKTGNVIEELNPRGIVHVSGEQWTAELIESDMPAPVGSKVEVVRIDGLKAIVRKVGDV